MKKAMIFLLMLGFIPMMVGATKPTCNPSNACSYIDFVQGNLQTQINNLECGHSECVCSVDQSDINELHSNVDEVWNYIEDHESSWSSSSGGSCGECSSSSITEIWNYIDAHEENWVSGDGPVYLTENYYTISGHGGMSSDSLGRYLTGKKNFFRDYEYYQNYSDDRYVLRSEYEYTRDRLDAVELLLIENRTFSMSEVDYKQAQVRAWRTGETQYYNDFVCYPNGFECQHK
jgi:hypothetical protein